MTKSFKIAALLALSFAACAPAHAEESLAVRTAGAVGSVIAAQGNAALATIRAEIRNTLRKQLQTFLPASAPAPQAAPAAAKQ